MLYAGLDLSRKRLDFHLLDGDGGTVDVGASPPDADGLRGLTRRLERHGAPIRAAIASMNGARFVHDRLEFAGWQVEIADAQKVKGLAPLACKTDRIDAWVLAEPARRDLVPAIWRPIHVCVPSASVPAAACTWCGTARASSSACKAVVLTHRKPCPVSDLFGMPGPRLLADLGLPEPWPGKQPPTPARTRPTASATNRPTARIGTQRGGKVAQIDLARPLAAAIWHMLSRGERFAPKGATDSCPPDGPRRRCATGARLQSAVS